MYSTARGNGPRLSGCATKTVISPSRVRTRISFSAITPPPPLPGAPLRGRSGRRAMQRPRPRPGSRRSMLGADKECAENGLFRPENGGFPHTPHTTPLAELRDDRIDGGRLHARGFEVGHDPSPLPL